MFKISNIKEKLKARLIKLYPMKSSDELISVFCKEALKKFIIILVSSFLIALLFLVLNKEETILQNGNILYRPSYNESGKEVTIKAGVESIENAKNVTLQIINFSF